MVALVPETEWLWASSEMRVLCISYSVVSDPQIGSEWGKAIMFKIGQHFLRNFNEGGNCQCVHRIYQMPQIIDQFLVQSFSYTIQDVTFELLYCMICVVCIIPSEYSYNKGLQDLHSLDVHQVEFCLHYCILRSHILIDREMGLRELMKDKWPC